MSIIPVPALPSNPVNKTVLQPNGPYPALVLINSETPSLAKGEYWYGVGEMRLAFTENISPHPSFANFGTIWLRNSYTAGAVGGYNFGFFSNHGLVVGQSSGAGAGGYFVGSSNSGLFNDGQIFAISEGYYAWGVGDFGPSSAFENSGLIAAKSTASRQNTSDAIGIVRFNGGLITNNASGVILAEGEWARGLLVGRGDLFGHNRFQIINHGTITAVSLDPDRPSYGMYIDHLSSEAMRIYNNGIITADIAIGVITPYSDPFSKNRAEYIYNDRNGIIDGKIILVDGPGTIVNFGSINGDILLGEGNDEYLGTNGRITGTVDGGAGNDRLFGSYGTDRLIGGDGHDLLVGDLGDDNLDGGGGTDRALYVASRAEATVARSTNGTVTISTKADGTDTLTNFEYVDFSGISYLVNRFASPSVAVEGEFSPSAGGWSSQDRFPRMAADVDGDGFADIVGFGQAGTVVALRQANGAFSAPTTAIANFGTNQGWTSDNTFHRDMADVNNDGRADVIGFGTFGVQVALAQANGTFAAPVTGSSNFNPANGWSSQDVFTRTLADVNGDGFADVVGFGIAGTFVALGTGSGTFGTANLALANFGRNQGWSSDAVFHRELGDVNGDGRDDIVGFGTFGTLVALGQANGTFAAPTLVLENFGTNQGWSTQDAFPRDLGDVNGDGRDDIVGFGLAGTFVAYGQANGTFSTAAFDLANFGRDQGWSSDNLLHRELADMNGDGTADIIGFGTSGVFIAAAFDGVVI